MSTPDIESKSGTPTGRRNSFAPVDFTEENSKQCLKQVEFYFSESNLPYDKFLRTTVEKNDGWVPISTIATFNRMKKYRPMDKVVEILRTSTILEVSADGENVKRTVPLDLSKAKETRLEQNKRTLVVMNVPFDYEKMKISTLQENLEKFFSDLTDNSISLVRLKRDFKKRFHGTVLIQFKDLEECEKFFNNYSGNNEDDNDGKDTDEGKDILSFEGRKLNVLTKKQYDLQREATRSKNFSGSGQRSRSFTGHRKNMPKLTPPTGTTDSAIDDDEAEEGDKEKKD